MNRRLPRWIAGIVALGLFFFLLLHTRPAKRAVASLVSSTVAWLLGPEVSIGTLEYRIWKGEAQAEQITFSDDDGAVPFVRSCFIRHIVSS